MFSRFSCGITETLPYNSSSKIYAPSPKAVRCGSQLWLGCGRENLWHNPRLEIDHSLTTGQLLVPNEAIAPNELVLLNH